MPKYEDSHQNVTPKEAFQRRPSAAAMKGYGQPGVSESKGPVKHNSDGGKSHMSCAGKPTK